MAKEPMGFGRVRREGEDTEAINRMFTPEFRNRLDRWCRFPICRRSCCTRGREIYSRVGNATFRPQCHHQVSKKAMDWLVEEGYDPQMGARPMARIIQENIKKPLADELLFGHLKGGGLVTVDLSKDKKLTLNIKMTSRQENR